MRLVGWLLAAVAMSLAVFELVMQPSASDRAVLAAIFLAVAAVALLATRVVPRLVSRVRSIRAVIAAAVLIAAGIVIGALGLAAEQMFLSDHDLRLVGVVLVFGLLAALGFGLSVSETISADLQRMAGVAESVARGEVGVHTGVDRPDEVGRLAVAIDRMSDALGEAASVRDRDDLARREFFAAVGHDLRSPLTSLRAAVEAMRDGLVSEPGRYLRSMDSDLAALESLVEDVFLLARLESGAFPIETVPVDVAELADETIEVMRSVADRRGVVLRLDAVDRVVVPAGPEAVGRVLRNLVDNAVRHAPHDSEVVVEVRPEGGAVVVVRDEGAGFEPEFVPHAFEPFSRSDPARVRDGSGSGLGLAIAHGFVTALGGEIWAEPGPGGRVGFHLPSTPSR